jgi:hypothetical protein
MLFMPLFFWKCTCCSVSYRRYDTSNPPRCERTWDVGGPAQPFAVDLSDGGIYVCAYPPRKTQGATQFATSLAKYDGGGSKIWSIPHASVSTIYPGVIVSGHVTVTQQQLAPLIGGVTVSPDGQSVAWSGQFVRTSPGSPTECLTLTDTNGNLKWSAGSQWQTFVDQGYFVMGDPCWSPDSQFLFLAQTKGVFDTQFTSVLKIDASTGAIVKRAPIFGIGLEVSNAVSLAYINGALIANDEFAFIWIDPDTLVADYQAYFGAVNTIVNDGGPIYQFPDGAVASCQQDPRFLGFRKWTLPNRTGKPIFQWAAVSGMGCAIDGQNQVYFSRNTKIARVTGTNLTDLGRGQIFANDDYNYPIPQKPGAQSNPSVFIRVDPTTNKPITGGDYVQFQDPG